MESDFTSTFLPPKSDTKLSGVPICRLVAAVRLEETFYRQNIVQVTF